MLRGSDWELLRRGYQWLGGGSGRMWLHQSVTVARGSGRMVSRTPCFLGLSGAGRFL